MIELQTKLRELGTSMEMGTSNIMPRTWELLDECIHLASAPSVGEELVEAGDATAGTPEPK